MYKHITISAYRNLILKTLIIALLLCAVYSVFLSHLKPFKYANLKSLDLLFSLNHKIHPPDKHIEDMVLVTIDDESMRELNLRWPWSRGVTAGIAKKLSESNPAVICMDLAFIGQSLDTQEDLILAKSFKDAGNVIVAAYFGSDRKYVTPNAIVAQGARAFGFINKPRDIDNTVRRMRPFVLSDSGDVIDYPLSLKAVELFSGKSSKEIVSSLPLLKNNTAYIRFFAKKDNFTTIPAWKILKGVFKPSQITGKIVFLGVTSEVFHDIYQTPLGIIPGVALLMNEALTYMTGNFFNYYPLWLNFIILFLFIYVALLFNFRLSIASGALLSGFELIGFFALSLYLFLHNVIIDYFGVFFLIISIFLFAYGARYIVLVINNIALKREAITDGLTQLYVFKYFDLKLKNELKKAINENENLALVIYDIDHFKKINDTYGHNFGNEVIKTFAGILKSSSRRYDTVARYGGEEFCILMPGIKHQDVIKHAERIRDKVGQAHFKADSGKVVTITISGGIVTIKDAVSHKHKDFIRAADTALYKAKNTGRNKVCVFNKNVDKLT